MSDRLEYIRTNRTKLFEIILHGISEYKYRNIRYDVDFSIGAVYCKDASINFEKLQKKLRKTDKVIYLNDNLCCIVFDGISEESCEKAAENINYHLLQINANHRYYLSVADIKNCNSKYAENCNLKYTDMIQRLFERLEYAIENNLENIVIYQDYVI